MHISYLALLNHVSHDQLKQAHQTSIIIVNQINKPPTENVPYEKKRKESALSVQADSCP